MQVAWRPVLVTRVPSRVITNSSNTFAMLSASAVHVAVCCVIVNTSTGASLSSAEQFEI